jgi:hypothetical protein
MMAVNTLLSVDAGCVNGAAATMMSASTVIQIKKVMGRGTSSSSRCSSPVHSSALAAASPA